MPLNDAFSDLHLGRYTPRVPCVPQDPLESNRVRRIDELPARHILEPNFLFRSPSTFKILALDNAVGHQEGKTSHDLKKPAPYRG
jgi:hypothetical protein